MIFEALWDSARHGELFLLDGGLCRWHLRADGQVTVREIISLRPGAGGEMLARLRAVPGATSVLARCPADLAANAWWRRRGFVLEGTERTRTGREVNVWRLSLT
jgi:hypothetical protein